MDAAQWPKAALVYDFHKEIGLVNPSEGSDAIIWSNSPSANSKQAKKTTRLNRSNQALNCPRCNSTNTKFCYYNNYNPTQPRYLCKACRRYWTHGGTLRNVPVGGSSRKKNKTSLAPSLQSDNSKLFIGLNPKPTTVSSPNFFAPAPPARSLMHDNHDLSMGLYYANVHHHFRQIPPTFELLASREALSSYHVPMSSQAMYEASTRPPYPSSSGFHFQDTIKPTLNLCKDEGFGGTSLDISNAEGAQKIPYYFGELKQDSATSTSAADNNTLDGDNGFTRDYSSNGVVYWNNDGLYN